MSDTLVKVENVSKKFCRSLKRSLWYGVRDVGAELLGRSHIQNGPPPLRTDEFWAVQDVNFELKRGDCLGLIGKNGAGKSTLLKMLNGLLKPDTGRIEMRGRIGALIELGTGFNPILTGRENVYVNGSVLGFSKKEIDRKFEAIVEFAEIGDFIDMPVKNYSSGMKVRLGFAVAAQMDPDVLLVDEVLAVGDVGFRIKCYNEIYRIMERAAVIFVSHSMPQIGKVCNRGLMLNAGKLVTISDNIADVIDSYYRQFSLGSAFVAGTGQATIEGIAFSNDEKSMTLTQPNLNQPILQEQLEYGRPLYISLLLQVCPTISKFNIFYAFVDTDQKLVGQCFSKTTDTGFENRGGLILLKTSIDSLNLNKGVYSLNITVRDSNKNGSGEIILATYRNIIEFQVSNPLFLGAASVQYDAQWGIEYLADDASFIS